MNMEAWAQVFVRPWDVTLVSSTFDRELRPRQLTSHNTHMRQHGPCITHTHTQHNQLKSVRNRAQHRHTLQQPLGLGCAGRHRQPHVHQQAGTTTKSRPSRRLVHWAVIRTAAGAATCAIISTARRCGSFVWQQVHNRHWAEHLARQRVCQAACLCIPPATETHTRAHGRHCC